MNAWQALSTWHEVAATPVFLTVCSLTARAASLHNELASNALLGATGRLVLMMHSIRGVATRCDWEDIFVAHQITFVGLQVFIDSHFSLVLLLCGPIISKGLVSGGRAWLHRLLERRVGRLLWIQKRQTRNVTTRVL